MIDLIDRRGADIAIGSEDEIFRQDALYAAIAGENIGIVKLLLDKGSDVNAIYTESGLIPLDLAVSTQNIGIVKLLLDRGAKVNGVGYLGFDYITYPLHTALEVENVEIVRLLLNNGADPTLEDRQGLNAIDLACNLGYDNDILNELDKKVE